MFLSFNKVSGYFSITGILFFWKTTCCWVFKIQTFNTLRRTNKIQIIIIISIAVAEVQTWLFKWKRSTWPDTTWSKCKIMNKIWKYECELYPHFSLIIILTQGLNHSPIPKKKKKLNKMRPGQLSSLWQISLFVRRHTKTHTCSLSLLPTTICVS